jgi:hypothetical protein
MSENTENTEKKVEEKKASRPKRAPRGNKKL